MIPARFLSNIDQLLATQRDELVSLTDDEFDVLMILCRKLRDTGTDQLRRLAAFAMLGLAMAGQSMATEEETETPP